MANRNPLLLRSTTESVEVIAQEDETYWEIGATLQNPSPLPLTHPANAKIYEALKTNTHPNESQEELGVGLFTTRDWRRAWHTYQSPPDEPNLIDPKSGFTEYEIEENMIEGKIPDDLVGCLYRNGPGKFGVGGDRVLHVLDADGLVIQVNFPPADDTDSNGKRRIRFRSRFVETEQMMKEEEANKFLYRSTFGTGPRGFIDPPRKGVNEDPWVSPLLSQMVGNAMKTDIKNSANTHVISFGGKVLALFEAGLPHQLDPNTLKALGEDTFDGVLKKGTPVKLGSDIPEEFTPDFLGGSAHTAHPNMCPTTGNLVGWHWSQLVSDGALEVTFTEWSNKDFSAVASTTHILKDCELAPHDMAITENCILLKVNSLKMNALNFISGMKGPAASVKMDGRSNVFVHIFPRPTAEHQFEPYVIEVPPCFSIHFSHAYEDPNTGHIVTYFSGWPPSDEKDFLGAWGGFAPEFQQIPTSLLWKLELDPATKQCVFLDVAPGAMNGNLELPLVHPNFTTREATYVYASCNNVVGDSTAPNGIARVNVKDGSSTKIPVGVKNEEMDVWWFGSRCFSGEPLVIPKEGGDLEDETDAYALVMVFDAVKDRSGVAIFDLKEELKAGPVGMVW
eukprot:CAMPEP_0204642666 /NCGR_PEP_ID=MMETSP0718-20130828/14_1 /ASSEMBLY_ACC=CAM_ASM_000674 /TAXON_ID=230516 /ORGANISM="Chaetoceros curvisetus" /LENGTH=619 /DNA_ID=CAMNT_0051663459 /DNA_START=29 /DNA_END=1885 /DNA_ORIENTATION=-